jgi:hypothetical protein
MQTIHLQIDDVLYEKLVNNNVDIQEETYKHLEGCVEDDGYPTISFGEAQTRVKKAVENYQNGEATYLTDKEYQNHKKKFIEELKVKYEGS